MIVATWATPAARRAAFAIVCLAGLAFGLALAPRADARRLAVRKYDENWTHLRSGGADVAVERLHSRARWDELRRQRPASSHHGHLQLGKQPVSLFKRRTLERRSSLRGGGAPTDTFVVKVAILRVEFETDRAGDRTTGDGRFQQVNPDPLNTFIDPAPHDDRYFRAHIEACSRYWSSMTYGRLRFEGDVFPRGERFGAYRLGDMDDYASRDPDEPFSIDGLINYSRESLIAADADPDLVWGDWDVLLVVHAGSDWQNDVLQNTPLDLPTFSISFSDSELVISDEGDTLSTMLTFPETSSQDGFLVGLNGGIAHEMGHQLGLFDLYNVETFAPTVAFYDLMDSGNLASVFVPSPANPDSVVEIIGILPTSVGAWSRWLVTFQFQNEPVVVKSDRLRTRLRAVQARPPHPPGVAPWFRLPISETEYFLVENRVDDLDGRFPDGSFKTALDQDDSTGVILGPIDEFDEISHNYDLLIDPGVLVWHVDERQALANFSQGRGLNVTFEKRSVTIEEADGLVDIGSPFSPFPLGTDKETFHAGNNANFTPTSRPNSDSNIGTPTGISIMNIGPRALDVTMDIGFTSKPRGWPMRIGSYGTSGGTSTTSADVDGDGVSEVAAVGETEAFLFRYDDRDGDGEVDPAGAWPAPSVGGMRGAPSFTQSLGDLDGDRRLEFICVSDSGGVYTFNADGSPYGAADSTGLLLDFGVDGAPTWSAIPADLDGNGTDELYIAGLDALLHGYDVPASGPPVTRFAPRPLAADSTASFTTTIAVGDVNDDGLLDGFISFVHQDSVHVQRFAANGQRILRIGHPLPDGVAADESTRVWLALADLDREAPGNALEIVLALESGWVLVLDDEAQILPGWPVQLAGPIGGPPAFGDIDGDGLLEMVLPEPTALHALNYNGTEVSGWPARPRLVDFPGDAVSSGSAAIADVDGDGRLDVVAGFTDFTVRAIGGDAKEIEEYRFPVGAPLVSAPAVLDANGDGRLDLFVQCDDGQIYAKILGGLASAGNPAWPMFAGGPRLHGSYEAGRLPAPVNPSGRLLAGEVRVYPNPVRSADEQVRIRYVLGADAGGAQVDVSLYNVAGEKVSSAKGTTFANTENVVTLSARDLASGIYFCTLRAREGSREERSQDRFAVVR